MFKCALPSWATLTKKVCGEKVGGVLQWRVYTLVRLILSPCLKIHQHRQDPKLTHLPPGHQGQDGRRAASILGQSQTRSADG